MNLDLIVVCFCPYFDVIDTDWDKQLNRSIQEALTDTSTKDFTQTLSKMIASLQDGHGRVIHRYTEKLVGFPFIVDWIENKVVVTLVIYGVVIQRFLLPKRSFGIATNIVVYGKYLKRMGIKCIRRARAFPLLLFIGGPTQPVVSDNDILHGNAVAVNTRFSSANTRSFYYALIEIFVAMLLEQFINIVK